MLCKRIIPCLDIKDGKTVKGINFGNLRDIGDPVEMAQVYQDQGADELVFLDISATLEGRNTTLELVNRIADVLMIPFTVGGGISSSDDVSRLLNAGADKVSVNSAAVNNPALISEIANSHGNQCCVLAMDVRRRKNNGWEVLTHGGTKTTDLDAQAWAEEAVKLGAGEILLTSWDRDGTGDGFDLELMKIFARDYPVPVIASGGAGGANSFIDVFLEADADAALAATIFHDGCWTVYRLKSELAKAGIEVRL